MIGWLAFYHGASALYASIITLALPIVVVQLIFAGGRFTGSSSGLSGFPTYYWPVNVWFWIAGVYLVVVTAIGFLFVRSDFGRILVAIRENEERCAYLGVPVSRIKIGLMMAAAGIGAVAGFGYAAFTNVVAPELAGFLLGTELLNNFVESEKRMRSFLGIDCHRGIRLAVGLVLIFFGLLQLCL